MSKSKRLLYEAIDYSRNPTWRRVFIVLAFLPFSYIAISAVYLSVQWDKIPDRIPQHYGLFSNQVNIWAGKGFWGVYFLLVFCGIVVTFMIPVFFFILNHPFKAVDPRDDSAVDQAREKLKGIIFFLAFVHGIALWICYVSIAKALHQHLMLKASSRLLDMILMVTLLPALFFVPLYYWLKLRLSLYKEDRAEKGDQAQDFSKPWKFGFLYWNPENPSPIVPRRFGTGYTLNFASRLAWVYLGFILFPPILVLTIIVILSCR